MDKRTEIEMDCTFVMFRDERRGILKVLPPDVKFRLEKVCFCLESYVLTE